MIPVPSLMLALVAFAPAAQRTEATADGEAARLIPPEASIVFRLQSVNAGHALLKTFAQMAGEDLGEQSAAEWMSDTMDVPGDTAKISLDAPVFVALEISMAGPVPTFIVPTGDPAGFAASLAELGDTGGKTWTSQSAGGYVGASQTAGYTLAAEPSAMLADLPAGTLAMHVDLAALIQTFRPLIEMGLEQAELQLDTIDEMSDMPFDMTPMLETYLDFAWDLIDSAKTYQMGFGEVAGELRATMDLMLLEGSPLASYGSEAKVDLTGFPGAVNPDASIVAIVGCDWKSLMEQMGPLFEDMLQMYPDEMSAAFKRYLDAATLAQSHMGPVVAASGDMGGEGLHFTYFMRSEAPEELVAALQEAVRAFSGEELGISLAAPTTAQVDGATIVSYAVEVDWHKLGALFASDDVDEDAVEAIQTAMAQLYGEGGLRISLAYKGQDVTAVFGGSEQDLRAAVARLGGPQGEVPPSLARALSAASGGSFGLVYRLDFGRMMEEMASMVSAMGGDEDEIDMLPTSSLPITVFGKLGGLHWAGGVTATMSEIQAFVAEGRAMQAARREAWEKELEVEIEEVPEEGGEDHEHEHEGEHEGAKGGEHGGQRDAA